MKKAIFWFLLIGLSLLLIFSALEFGLRLRTAQVEKYEGAYTDTLIVLNEELGWKQLPGNFEFSPIEGGRDRSIQYTVDAQFGRLTSDEAQNNSDSIWLIGGSYVFGEGLSNDETFAWKLKESLSNINVYNYGVMGYGTYQSLLFLENRLEAGSGISLVIYGYIEDHERRNVAAGNWLEDIRKQSQPKKINFPYVSLSENNQLQRHMCAGCSLFDSSSDLMIHEYYKRYRYRLASRPQYNQRAKVTEQLLIEMKQLCDKNNLSFAVMVFEISRERTKAFVEFLAMHNIEFINCTIVLDEMKMPENGHPNKAINAVWADCAAQYYQEKIQSGN